MILIEELIFIIQYLYICYYKNTLEHRLMYDLILGRK